ncbi:MAG: DUF4364 family protein [Oscillospiraceae bacterium]|nr:DUF4364 family protein [Oscillospiraceae bacterium]
MERRLGFIHGEIELKVLILFILRRIKSPVPKNELTEATLLCDDGFSYFDFTDCLGDLVDRGQVAQADDFFTITPKGRDNGETMENDLPYSVRIRAEKSADSLNRKLERDRLISTGHELMKSGGFTVRLSLSDGEAQLMDMTLLCGDEEMAHRLEKGFRFDAEQIYFDMVERILDSAGDADRKTQE